MKKFLPPSLLQKRIFSFLKSLAKLGPSEYHTPYMFMEEKPILSEHFHFYGHFFHSEDTLLYTEVFVLDKVLSLLVQTDVQLLVRTLPFFVTQHL